MMPTALSSCKDQLSPIDAQAIEDALRVIARKWTSWITQSLSWQHGPVRVCEIAAQLRFISNIYRPLDTMHSDGLVTRTGDHTNLSYELTDRGRALLAVHRALSEWSQEHLLPEETAFAERAEDAARRLHLRKSTAVIQALTYGPMTPFDVCETTNMGQGYALRRLERLRSDGVVTRAGAQHGAPHTLTVAGRELGPVYSAIGSWSAMDARHGLEAGR